MAIVSLESDLCRHLRVMTYFRAPLLPDTTMASFGPQVSNPIFLLLNIQSISFKEKLYLQKLLCKANANTM